MRELSDHQAVALAYVCEHPGVTSGAVAAGTGLPASFARRSLEALYTKKLVGRQHSLLSVKPALYFPEPVALYAHQRAQEAQP